MRENSAPPNNPCACHQRIGSRTAMLSTLRCFGLFRHERPVYQAFAMTIPSIAELDHAARLLDAHPEFRVLRRLRPGDCLYNGPPQGEMRVASKPRAIVGMQRCGSGGEPFRRTNWKARQNGCGRTSTPDGAVRPSFRSRPVNGIAQLQYSVSFHHQSYRSLAMTVTGRTAIMQP